jgi:hypothetical protein
VDIVGLLVEHRRALEIVDRTRTIATPARDKRARVMGKRRRRGIAQCLCDRDAALTLRLGALIIPLARGNQPSDRQQLSRGGCLALAESSQPTLDPLERQRELAAKLVNV